MSQTRTDKTREFYDNKEKISHTESVVSSARRYNNWIKSCLISRFTQRGNTVLDFSGGRGEDLLKWSKNFPSFVLLTDYSERSLAVATNRYKSQRSNYSFDLETKLIDANNFSVEDLGNYKFDVISCQFAINYFDDIAKVFEIWNSVLKRSGRVIISYTSAEEIKKHPYGKFYSADIKKNGYNYTMSDTVNNVFEYFVSEEELEKHAKKLKWKKKLSGSFRDFFDQEATKNELIIFLKMVFPQQETFDKHNWQIISLYNFIVFEK